MKENITKQNGRLTHHKRFVLDSTHRIVKKEYKDAIRTEAIDFKDALLTIMHTQEALIKLLVRKGIITEEELLEEVKKIKNKKRLRLG